METAVERVKRVHDYTKQPTDNNSIKCQSLADTPTNSPLKKVIQPGCPRSSQQMSPYSLQSTRSVKIKTPSSRNYSVLRNVSARTPTPSALCPLLLEM